MAGEEAQQAEGEQASRDPPHALVVLVCLGFHCSGKTEEGLTAYVRNGRQLWRRPTVPRNPKTERQEQHRGRFSEASREWRALSEEERAAWNALAEGQSLTGYNLFLRSRLREGGGRVPAKLAPSPSSRASP